jgi:PKD repeat protein/C1A family cysteine protease
MKKAILLVTLLGYFLTLNVLANAQNKKDNFKMAVEKSATIDYNQVFTTSAELFPFGKNGAKIYGIAVSAEINLADENGLVRLLLVDDNQNEYLLYEGYALLEENLKWQIDEICEETAVLEGIKAHSVIIEVDNATLLLKNFSIATKPEPGIKADVVKKEKKQGQDEEKIEKINKKLKEKGLNWVAGRTAVSDLSYAERKMLYGQSTFPAAFEYYAGGIISTGTAGAEEINLKSATASQYVDDWDWRNRHGKNWITPVRDQVLCGSCWAFAVTGATEAMVNLYFNQQLNLDLAEQELVSCSGAGSCSGGYPYQALDFIKNNGIIDEFTFPYVEDNSSCVNKGSNPKELIKISGRYDFGSSLYPKNEDVLKDMLIKMGPVSSGLANWNHAMTLVGYKLVKEGDTFYYRDLELKRYWKTVQAGDPLIGKTVWIFKNSWGGTWGDEGYIYVETTITNIGWTHGIKMPVISLINNYQAICEDRDGDGYYWWGLGPKPLGCNCPDTPDGDDSDPTRGPIDAYGNLTILNFAPLADFTSDKTTLTEGESILFADRSSQGTTSWLWSFEGGNPATSSAQNPAVSYAAPGSYKVTLTASNKYGSNTKSVSGYITANKIIPSYCASKGNGSSDWIASVSVGGKAISTGSTGSAGYGEYTLLNFKGQAGTTISLTLTPGFTSTIYSQVWHVWIDLNQDCDFDDPGELIYTSELTNQVVNASVKLPTMGGATTRMRVSMKRGGAPSPCETFAYGEVEDYTFIIDPAVGSPPVAGFTAGKTKVLVNENVQFYDQSTGNVTSHSWVFDGGNPSNSNLKDPVVKYATAGTYRVSLAVANEYGSDTKTADAFIVVEAPVMPKADFTVSKTIIKEGESVTFTDLSTGGVTSWNWTFDGGNPNASTLQNPVVKYSVAGKYKVSLTAKNASGSNTETAEGLITVEAAVMPAANFTASKTVIKEGESITFTDLSTGGITAWNWTFDGGNPSTSTIQNPVVKYSVAGNYKVSLIAKNANGSDTKTADGYITVEALVMPVADFTASKTVIKEGESIIFTDLSSGSITSWNWTLDGGNPSSSTLQNPVVKYPVAGKYKVSLTAKNANGTSTKTAEGYLTVEASEPLAAGFTSSGNLIEEGGQVQFYDTSTGGPTEWQWSFPGGTPSTSTAQNPMVTYAVAGAYDVGLTVAKGAPASAEVVVNDYVSVVEKPGPAYCTPVSIVSSSDYISQVTIGDALHSTSAGTGYSVSDEMTYLSPGQRYNVTLVPTVTNNKSFWRLWIDFNADGDFNDSGETLVVQNNKKGTVSTSILIPTYASGNTMMRVTMRNGNSPGPCDDNFKGEVEDYPVLILAKPQASEYTSAELPAQEIDAAIKIYPNPVTDNLTIQLNTVGTNDGYTLYNPQGSKLQADRIYSEQILINLSGYANGFYFLVIENNNQIIREKIIKK